jgi:hypothetical protein
VSGLEQFASTPFAVAVQKYEKMSKFADKFASNPIVIAKAIARAVKARRASARYVAPRSTNMILAMSAFLPRPVWDWMMRKAGFLAPKYLGLATPAAQVPAAIDMTAGAPTAKPPAAARLSAN